MFKLNSLEALYHKRFSLNVCSFVKVCLEFLEARTRPLNIIKSDIYSFDTVNYM